MTLSWSMDKLGPICRSVEDCALVFGAIHGCDGHDLAAVDRPFAWPRAARRAVAASRLLRRRQAARRAAGDRRAARSWASSSCRSSCPTSYPVGPLTLILNTEAAAAFDDLTGTASREGIGRWASTFRKGQFVPAVEYLRANRIRTLLMREMDEVMSQVDCYVGGDDLMLTNLTGHPTVVVPDGDREREQDRPAGHDHLHRPAVRRNGAALAGPRLPASDRRPPPPAAAGGIARKSLQTAVKWNDSRGGSAR